MAGYLTALNNYRTQCGIPALSQNTVLDSVAASIGNDSGTPPYQLAAAAGYAVPTTVGGIASNYWSNSVNDAWVGQLELQTAMMDYQALLNMMRPYTDIGMVPTLGKAGSIHQRGALVMFGNPVSRNTTAPVTFPCANTTDIAPYDRAVGGGWATRVELPQRFRVMALWVPTVIRARRLQSFPTPAIPWC